MKTCEKKRLCVFAKTQSDLRAKIGVRKIDVHVFAMSHSCQLNIKHEFQAKHRGQRADVKWRYQFSACRVKRDNSGFSKNLSRNSKPTFGRPAAGLRPASGQPAGPLVTVHTPADLCPAAHFPIQK